MTDAGFCAGDEHVCGRHCGCWLLLVLVVFVLLTGFRPDVFDMVLEFVVKLPLSLEDHG